ncbi:hypothetical protein BDF14DRAFT_1835199 [Spinellus fusiger]|nr:hypothetical protein BDF14DRAFT_1835199 [Spinellus fusiger]
MAYSITKEDSPFPIGSISKMNSMKPLYPTRCVHTISQEDNNSVLSLAASENYLFSGSQSSKIHVWDMQTFTLVTMLEGHVGSVLGLALSEDKYWLFSCSGDGTLRVWDTKTLKCVYSILSAHDVGDVFSLVYSEKSKTLFFGSQNTSIQWFDLNDPQTLGSAKDIPIVPISLRNSQKLKFFGDACGVVQDSVALEQDVVRCIVREKNVYLNAHDGYVYCLLYSQEIPNIDGEVIISGSGDGDIKIWSLVDSNIKHIQTLKGNSDKGVLSLTLSEDGYLFCGVQGGDVMYQLIRSVMAHSDDVLAVALKGPGLVSASADGTIKVWSEGFEFRESLDDHDGAVLSLTTSRNYLITGSSDHSIKFWDLPSTVSNIEQFRRSNVVKESPCNDAFIYVLEKWIGMRTVGGNPKYMEECRRGARFLKSVLQQLGAVSRMIPGVCGRNPLVYGKFIGKASGADASKKIPTVLIYGHYDVIAADEEQEWNSDPFILTGRNGYLYGRGISDNKGPILSCIFGVNELLKEGLLDVNVIFLIEGEEESGSVGFHEAVNKHKDLFKDVDMILLSNSYWLGEDVPCLTYGLRGVVHASITVCNARSDMHSGVEGGAISEPLIDLIHVLSKFVDKDKKVLIPGFYDNVCPLTEEEKRLYDPIVEWMKKTKDAPLGSKSQRSSGQSPVLIILDTEKFTQDLMSRWRYPTFTVHKIDVSINNPTIIPRSATATVSMRIVPDQSISEICQQFQDHIKNVFEETNSETTISVEIKSASEHWLGDPQNKYFKAVEKAIEEEWNVKPLYIREGGSIPAVKWLEKFCDAPAVHLPMGQASDQAHLHNERIRLKNIHAGRRIVKRLLQMLPGLV